LQDELSKRGAELRQEKPLSRGISQNSMLEQVMTQMKETQLELQQIKTENTKMKHELLA